MSQVLLGLNLAVGVVGLITLVVAIGRWVGRQEADNHATPQPQNLGMVERHEQELQRCRDRLHALEGFRQSINAVMEDRYTSRREWTLYQEEFNRLRTTVEAISRREDGHGK